MAPWLLWRKGRLMVKVRKVKLFKNYVRVHKIIKSGVAIYDMANITEKKGMDLKRWKVVENT